MLFAEKYHGTGGYLTVGEPPFRSPLAVALVAGGVEMGYENVDINAERQTGEMTISGTKSLLNALHF